MKITQTELSSMPLFVLEGEMDHGSGDMVYPRIRQALDEQAQIVLLDLEQVPYIDSGGLSILVRTLHHLQQEGWVGLIKPPEEVLWVLELSGLRGHPKLRVFPTKEAAQAALTT